MDIHKATEREKLRRKHPRNDPFWRNVARGRAIGFDPWRDTWHARMRPEDGGKKYELKALGKLAGWDEAVTEAEHWFKERAAGIDAGEVQTVEQACRHYVAERGKSKSEDCAHDAEKRFERTIYGQPFGRSKLAKFRAAKMREWRDGLGLAPAANNRTLTAVKAALHLAVHERFASAELREELRRVKPFPGANKRRDLYLDLPQRRALLDAATGAVRALIEAAMLTGARAGELVSATRSQFDARTGTLRLTGKTGTRLVPLAPAALVLFKRLAQDKLPAARLLTRDDGKPWAHSDWDELVRDAAAAAVLKDGKGNALKDDKGRVVKLPAGVCLYTLRHSFITAALTDGMSTLDVARMVGTSLQMVDRHYGHLVASAARERLAQVSLL